MSHVRGHGVLEDTGRYELTPEEIALEVDDRCGLDVG
jgi:hypothetical protein